LALFDLDGTLVVGQTQVLLIRYLRKAGVVSRAFLLGTGLWFLAYKAGLVKVTEESREKAARMFQGRSVKEVAGLMTSFTQEVMVPRLHPAASAAVAEHLREGDRVVVVSAALEPLVKGLCRHLGVQDWAAASCEVRDGRYTGRLDGPTPYAAQKARVAESLMARWGVDPAVCWAYADHDTDLALLRSVGHPVAVHPRPRLLAEARRAGWPILP